MTQEKEQTVYQVLENLGITYLKYEHAPVFTIEQANELSIDTNAQQCKNLFIRNRKGNEHYLVILEESKRVDLKKIASQIRNTPLSFASEERLLGFLNLTPGSVTPFGLIYNEEKNVIVLIDKDLTSAESLCFHPNVNTATIEMSYSDFERFLEWCGNKKVYVDI